MANYTDVSIGRNVKAEMVRRGVKQQDLASVLGVSQQTLSDRLAGRTPWKATDLAKVAEHLSLTVGELLGEVPA